jgi:hypothetical protein
MHKGRVLQLNHARMNMYLVTCDQPTDVDVSEGLDMESMSASVLDVVSGIDDSAGGGS